MAKRNFVDPPSSICLHLVRHIIVALTLNVECIRLVNNKIPMGLLICKLATKLNKLVLAMPRLWIFCWRYSESPKERDRAQER